MQFHRSSEDVQKFLKSGPFVATFTGAEMLTVVAETDPHVVTDVLPPPLHAPPDPRLMAFVAHYPETNFGVSYHEGALLVEAQRRGERGWYCLSMPVTDDTAMILGREIDGFPKKMADDITLEEDPPGSGHVTGAVTRRGTEILRIEGDFQEEVAPTDLPMPGDRVADLQGRDAFAGVSFLMKYGPAASGFGFAHLPQLVRQVTLFTPLPGQHLGEAKLSLESTDVDGLGDIPVGDVLAAWHGRLDAAMMPGRVVGRVYNPFAFAPYSMFNDDIYSLVDPRSLPQLSWRRRRAARRRLARY